MTPDSSRRALPARAAAGPLLASLLAAPLALAAPPATDLVFRLSGAAEARALLAAPASLEGAAGGRLAPALEGSAGAPGGLEAILRLSLPPGADVAAARKAVAALGPRWMETPPPRRTDLVPDDPRYGELWSLPLIQAPQAWDVDTGTGAVVVAVVDTGTDLDHPDLAAALWSNPAEAGGAAGVDDDGNGVVDDLHGADLLDGDGDPNPAAGDLSHGTHTAGTAACVTDNGEGVACPAWRAALMPVRAGHQGTISRGPEGIWYAARMGARVISCSWGGNSYSAYEDEVVQAARALGALVVASAGNDGSERPHYPAAYEGVLAVAATSPGDTRMPGSQVGWWVDCCAPGEAILSCLIGGGYGLKSGTSMATPLAASVAALACEHWPGEDGDQIRERVKAGCDAIDALNPGLEGKLGRGRVNAWRTLTQAVRAVALRGRVLADADGDGVPEPGEALTLRLSVEALLGDFSGLALTATATAGEAVLQDAAIFFGALAQGQSATPADFLALTLDPGLAPGQEIRLHLLFTASGGFSQTEELPVLVAPTYVDHDNGRLQLSLGGHGVQGYYDFAENEAVGNGLRWPPGSPGHLYHGSLLAATAGGEVAHATSYLAGTASELVVLPGGEIRRTALGGLVDSEAEFGATVIPDLRVRQLGHSLAGEDWVLVRFLLWNEGIQPLSGLLPALWLDLDVAGTWSDDTGGWDAVSGTGWQSQAGGPLVGLRLLSEPAAAFRLCHWGEWSAGGLEDAELWDWLAAGFTQTASDQARDWQCLLGAAAEDLPPGGEREFAVALVAGTGLAELRAAGEAALAAWQGLAVAAAPAARPAGLELSAWPNPFNPATRFAVTLPRPGDLSWRVVGLDGRQVAAGRRAGLPAGRHELTLLLSGQASGLYLLEVEQEGRRAVTRLLLVR